MGPLRGPGSEGSEGSACLWQAGSKGGGGALRAMSFIMPPAAVTSASSIIIRITTVHPFATSWPSSPKGGARTLRDLLSVSYGKITILLTGSLRSPPLSGLRRTSPRESVSHDSQVALLPYESCSLATPSGGQDKSLYAFLQRHDPIAKHP